MRLALAFALLVGADKGIESEALDTKGSNKLRSTSTVAVEQSQQATTPQSHHVKEMKFLQWTMKSGKLGGALRNSNSDKPHRIEARECDPTSTSPDFGILSCGYNHYCVESDDSNLGGLCLLDQKTAESRVLQSTGRNESSSSLSNTILRRKGHNELFQALSQACRETDYCDCSEFDFQSFQGIVECNKVEDYCSRSENYCGEDVELCYSFHTTLEANGRDNYSYTTCMTYTTPYQQRVCMSYSTADSESCAVDFNNNMCQSCTPELRTYKSVYELNGQPHIYSYSQRCFQFDCTDNEGGHSGNTCDRNVATIQYNIVFGDDCARCQACGIGFKMTKADNFGIFPLVGHYQCSGLELGSIIGYFDRQLCNDIQAATFDTCGCEPIFYDPDLLREPGIVGNETETCFICGTEDAVVTRPDQTIILPTSSTTCAELMASAMMGHYSVSYCQDHIQPRAQSVCGCAKTLLPDNGVVFHDGSLEAHRAPSTSPSPTVTQHPEAEELNVGSGFVCQVCPNGTVVNPDGFVSLNNGVTTCSGLEAAGLAGFFSSLYCYEEVVYLAMYGDCCSNTTSGLIDDAVLDEPTTSPTIISYNDASPPSPIAASTNLPTQSPIESTSPRFVPGFQLNFNDFGSTTKESEKVVCNVCEKNGIIQNPTKLVSLLNGVTTCGDLDKAGLLGVFTQEFCEVEAKAIASSDCGCIAGMQVSALSSISHHQVDPSEVNVGEDSNSSARTIRRSFVTTAAAIVVWASPWM